MQCQIHTYYTPSSIHSVTAKKHYSRVSSHAWVSYMDSSLIRLPAIQKCCGSLSFRLYIFHAMSSPDEIRYTKYSCLWSNIIRFRARISFFWIEQQWLASFCRIFGFWRRCHQVLCEEIAMPFFFYKPHRGLMFLCLSMKVRN